jgi:hypothetical protein
MRAGLRVLRPHWDDDEMDLIVLAEHPRRPIPLPVQIKAIQARASGEDVVRVDRVRRRYVDTNPGICLAVYSHPNDKMWFLAGARAVRDTHAAQTAAANARPGRRGPLRSAYEALGPEQTVPIDVNVGDPGDLDFDRQWLVDRYTPKPLTDVIRDLARAVEEAVFAPTTHSVGGVQPDPAAAAEPGAREPDVSSDE